MRKKQKDNLVVVDGVTYMIAENVRMEMAVFEKTTDDKWHEHDLDFESKRLPEEVKEKARRILFRDFAEATGCTFGPQTWEWLIEILPAYEGGIYESVDDGITYRGLIKKSSWIETEGVIVFEFTTLFQRIREGWHRFSRNTCREFYTRSSNPPSEPFLLSDKRIIASIISGTGKRKQIHQVTIYPPNFLPTLVETVERTTKKK